MNAKELRLRSEAGYNRVREKLAGTRFELCEIESFVTWTSTVKSKRSKVRIRCTLCNFNYEVVLGTLMKPSFSGMCHCRRECRSESDDYYQRFLDAIRSTTFSMVDVHSISDWKTQVAQHGCVTKIAVKCGECGVVARPWVSSFIRTGKAACLCSGALHCRTEEYYEFICGLVEPSRFEMAIGSYQEWSGIVTNVKSRIELKCTTCSMTVAPTVNMVQHGSVGCGCRNFNCEARVFKFVQLVLNSMNGCGLKCVSQKTEDGLVSVVCQRLLCLDIAVLDIGGKIVLAIEVDGGHHFDPYFKYGNDSKHRRTMQNDLQKEKWAIAMKVPMLRITSDCILNNRVQWNAWIQGALIKVAQSNIEPRIYRRSHHDCYSSIHYVRMRKEHQELEDGIPFPLAVDPLPFPPALL